jgi:hypothetical protein
MSKRVFSLDEDDEVKQDSKPLNRKKERKSYSNCFHATRLNQE